MQMQVVVPEKRFKRVGFWQHVVVFLDDTCTNLIWVFKGISQVCFFPKWMVCFGCFCTWKGALCFCGRMVQTSEGLYMSGKRCFNEVPYEL